MKKKMMMKKNRISPFYFDLNKSEINDLTKNFSKILKSSKLILGNETLKFESQFAKYIGTKYAIAVNSGTTALQILLMLNIKKIKTLVAVPTNTNFATVAAILYSGGTPLYLDMDQKYFAPKYQEIVMLYKKFKFKGIVWVHIGGIMSPDFIKVKNFCNKRKIFLIEDCAHAHGSSIKGIKAGSKSSGGAFSFFPTKVMTTMEGGMITTNDKFVYNRAMSLRNQGKRKGNFGGLHQDLGNSWRISEVAASLGLIQLKKLKKMIRKRNQIYKIYSKTFDKEKIPYCKIDHMDVCSNYKLIVFAKNKKHKKKLKKQLVDHGVLCGGEVYEIPCHKQPVFKKLVRVKNKLNISENYCSIHFCPPMTSGMSIKEAMYCAKVIAKVY
tara:strand:- start:202 stop:1347 length:1146 start_codon:yes stop_codon:yes gene_type:complete